MKIIFLTLAVASLIPQLSLAMDLAHKVYLADPRELTLDKQYQSTMTKALNECRYVLIDATKGQPYVLQIAKEDLLHCDRQKTQITAR